MAKIAFKVPHGAKIGDACVRDGANLVEAKNVSIRDRKSMFQCCGGANGIPCGAEMTFVKQQRGAGYFASISKSSSHIQGCPFDQSLAAKKLKHLSVTGEGLSDDKLLGYLQKDGERIHKRMEDDGTGPKVITKTGDRATAKRDDDLDLRPIELEAVDPHKLSALFKILKNIPEGDIYAGMDISKRLINGRAIEVVRNEGLGHSSWAVFVVKKTLKAHEIRQDESEFIFEDAYACASKKTPAYIALRIRNEKIRMQMVSMFKNSPFDARILVCDQWIFERRNGFNVFISKHYLNAGYFLLLNKDEYLD